MDILRVIFTALFSILLLFGFTKWTGCRQVSQLSMFDYINGISIGSIAAELATAEGAELWKWATALCVYGSVTALLGLLTSRSINLRRFITGRSILLMEHGTLYDKNFARAHLDLNEFLVQLRGSGYFNLDELDTVLFEPNGRLSILAKSEYRATQPQDFELTPKQESVPINVILDGEVLTGNLQQAGFDRAWLTQQLTAQGLTLSDVFIGLCTADRKLRVFPRGGGTKKDTLE